MFRRVSTCVDEGTKLEFVVLARLSLDRGDFRRFQLASKSWRVSAAEACVQGSSHTPWLPHVMPVFPPVNLGLVPAGLGLSGLGMSGFSEEPSLLACSCTHHQLL